jgi:tetratricopeptide (TPR) repeat protein
MLSLLCATLISAAPPAVPSVGDVTQELRGIESAVMRGKIDELRIKYQDQARAKPSDVLLRVYIAWCVLPSDDAWNQLKSIAAINPDNPWVHLGMGRTYTAWKMRDQARTEYLTILKKDPKFVAALVGMADLKLAEGDLGAAEAQYRGALEISDDARGRGGLGLTLLQAGKGEAKVELEKAINLWPDQPAVLQALLKLHREANDTKAAGDVATRLAELAPKDAEVRRAVADLRFESGDKVEAAKEYEKLLKVAGPTVEVLTRLEGIYREVTNPEAEEKALQLHAAIDKADPAPNLRLAELAEAKGNAELAETQLVEAIDRDPTRAMAHLRLARVRAKRNAFYEALGEYRAAGKAAGEGTAEAAKEMVELEKKIKLPAKPAKGSVDSIYASVARSLNDFYGERRREKPDLAGDYKVRVKVKASGEVDLVEMVSDTVGDPLLAAHLYFALHDAGYQKQKREPVFEFELGNVKKAK